jgi:hypothetical protein
VVTNYDLESNATKLHKKHNFWNEIKIINPQDLILYSYFKTRSRYWKLAIENKKEIIYSLGLIMPNFKTDAHFSSEDDFLLDPKDLILYSHWFYKSKRYFELLENN